jgi:hypothetical protein
MQMGAAGMSGEIRLMTTKLDPQKAVVSTRIAAPRLGVLQRAPADA